MILTYINVTLYAIIMYLIARYYVYPLFQYINDRYLRCD
jgi:Kef-type K+ transport system membrane component KefB